MRPKVCTELQCLDIHLQIERKWVQNYLDVLSFLKKTLFLGNISLHNLQRGRSCPARFIYEYYGTAIAYNISGVFCKT